MFKALAGFDALEFILEVGVVKFTCLYTSGVAPQFSGGLLEVIMCQGHILGRFVRNAIDRGFHSLHDLLAHEIVLVCLDLCLQLLQVPIWESL